MVTEMMVMRNNDKKIQRCDDQTNKNGPLLRSFFFLKKGMALSHLPMMQITMQDRLWKKRGNLLFGRLGVVGIRPFLRVVILADPTNPSPFLSHDLFTFSLNV